MAAPWASMRANSGYAQMYQFMMRGWKKAPTCTESRTARTYKWRFCKLQSDHITGVLDLFSDLTLWLCRSSSLRSQITLLHVTSISMKHNRHLLPVSALFYTTIRLLYWSHEHFLPSRKMLRGEAKYKCVLGFRKHEMVSAERDTEERSAVLPCDLQPLRPATFPEVTPLEVTSPWSQPSALTVPGGTAPIQRILD